MPSPMDRFYATSLPMPRYFAIALLLLPFLAALGPVCMNAEEVRGAQPVAPARPAASRPPASPSPATPGAPPVSLPSAGAGALATDKSNASAGGSFGISSTPKPAGAGKAGSGTADPTLTIAADGSLRSVMAELAQAFADEYADAPTLALEFTNAGGVQKRLSEAPRWDVVILAGADEAKLATTASRIEPEGQKIVARGMLIVLGRRPKDPAVAAAKWPALMGTEWKSVAIGTPGMTASGRAAEAALRKRDLFTKLEHEKAISYGGTEGIILNILKKGDADAFILLKTDLSPTSKWPADAKKKILDYSAYVVEEDDYPAVLYTAAVIPGTRRKEEAAEFISFLVSPAARTIWIKHGFPVQ